MLPVHMNAGVEIERHIQAELLDPVALLACAATLPASGAQVSFFGIVRDHNHGRAVTALEYEAHPALAARVIAEILTAARERFAVQRVDCVHRVGRLGVGEVAVAVLTEAAHRDAAYAANRYIIDRVKHEAPIWKKEHFADGTSEWSAGCTHHS